MKKIFKKLNLMLLALMLVFALMGCNDNVYGGSDGTLGAPDLKREVKINWGNVESVEYVKEGDSVNPYSFKVPESINENQSPIFFLNGEEVFSEITVNNDLVLEVQLTEHKSGEEVGFSSGFGTFNNPYLANNSEELLSLNSLDSNSRYYVNLLNDVALENDKLVISNGKRVILDLNGNTITYSSTNGDKSRPVKVESGAFLEVNSTSNSRNNFAGGITINKENKEVFGVFHNNGNLIINGGSYLANGDGEGAILRNFDGAEVKVTNGLFYDEGFNAAANLEGKILIENGTFATQSSNRGGWNYSLRMGGDATVLNATVYGIQGGIAIYKGAALIENADVRVYDWINAENNDGDRSFYAVYINGERGEINKPIVINGGNYLAGKMTSLRVGNRTQGDGGLGLPAEVIVNGGNFFSPNANFVYEEGSKVTNVGGNFLVAPEEQYIPETHKVVEKVALNGFEYKSIVKK